MDSKKIIMVCIIIVIVAGAVSSFFILNQAEETQLTVLSGNSLYNGENLTVKLTTKDGTPVAGQQVSMAIVDSNGWRNVVNLTTNESGIASYEVSGMSVGQYSLEASFGGNGGYGSSNVTGTFEIKEEVKTTTVSNAKI